MDFTLRLRLGHEVVHLFVHIGCARLNVVCPQVQLLLCGEALVIKLLLIKGVIQWRRRHVGAHHVAAEGAADRHVGHGSRNWSLRTDKFVVVVDNGTIVVNAGHIVATVMVHQELFDVSIASWRGVAGLWDLLHLNMRRVKPDIIGSLVHLNGRTDLLKWLRRC